MITQQHCARAWAGVKLTRDDIDATKYCITIPQEHLGARGFNLLRGVRLMAAFEPFFHAFGVAACQLQPEDSDDIRDATYPMIDIADRHVKQWEVKYDKVAQWRRVDAFLRNHGPHGP